MHLAPRTLPLLASLALAFGGCATSISHPDVALQPVQNPIPPTRPGVYDISKVDVIPVTTNRVDTRYPFELRRAGVSGEAMILFTANPDGSVSDPMVVKATDIRFGEAALEAVAQWRMRPALLAGRPVHCRLMVPILFTLGGI